MVNRPFTHHAKLPCAFRSETVEPKATARTRYALPAMAVAIERGNIHCTLKRAGTSTPVRGGDAYIRRWCHLRCVRGYSQHVLVSVFSCCLVMTLRRCCSLSVVGGSAPTSPHPGPRFCIFDLCRRRTSFIRPGKQLRCLLASVSSLDIDDSACCGHDFNPDLALPVPGFCFAGSRSAELGQTQHQEGRRLHSAQENQQLTDTGARSRLCSAVAACAGRR